MPLDQGQLLTIGIPPQITDLVQTRTWEREFHDALFPLLLFRADMKAEQWPANLGARMAMTRTGLMSVSTTPLTAGQDPIPGSYASEQWEATAAQYSGTLDTHLPTSVAAASSEFLENMQKIGLNAGQTLNHLARNQIFNAYLGGQTVTNTTGTQLTIHVLQLAGFLTNIPAGGAAPAVLSTNNPLIVTIKAGTANAPSATCVLSTPDNANNPQGPGTLTFLASVTVAAGDAIEASTMSYRIRVGAAHADDALTISNIPTLQTFASATAQLRQYNVPPHADRYYHAHINPITESEIFEDPAFQRALTALPDSLWYRELALGMLLGIVFFRNTEAPSPNSVYSGESFPWEVYESSSGTTPGLSIYRDIVTGHGVAAEKYVPEAQYYMSEAGVMGKVGEPQVTNNGVIVDTERVRLILRAPLDRLQQVVATSWSWTGDFPIASDITTGGTVARYKRAVAIIHA